MKSINYTKKNKIQNNSKKNINNKNNKNNINKSKSSNKNLSTKKLNNSYNINNQSKNDFLNSKNGKEIQKEKSEYNIKLLKDMLNAKKKEIETLEYELKLQQMAEKGQGYLDYELNLWQKKTNNLSTVFYQQFNSLKSEAYLDKNEFQNLIHNMKKICEKNQSYEENICEEILNKQEWFINTLNNKNKDIKNRLEKMKNVFK